MSAPATDYRMEGTPLSATERRAMRDFKRMVATNYCIGTRRMTSMLALERRGLVQRVMYGNRIADWRLTKAGQEWAE